MMPAFSTETSSFTLFLMGNGNVLAVVKQYGSQVVAPARSWSALRFFMSTRYLFCDFDCPSVVTSPCHTSGPSLFASSYVPDNI